MFLNVYKRKITCGNVFLIVWHSLLSTQQQRYLNFIYIIFVLRCALYTCMRTYIEKGTVCIGIDLNLFYMHKSRTIYELLHDAIYSLEKYIYKVKM